MEVGALPNSPESATAFAENLQAWGETLPESQQQVLESLMIMAISRVDDLMGPNALDADDPDFALLSHAAESLNKLEVDDQGAVILTTPCITVTTTITVARTSKWVCTPPRRPRPKP